MHARLLLQQMHAIPRSGIPVVWTEGGRGGFGVTRGRTWAEISPRTDRLKTSDGRQGRGGFAAREMGYPQRDWAAGQTRTVMATVHGRAQGKIRRDPQGRAVLVVPAGENRRNRPPPWAHQQPRGRRTALTEPDNDGLAGLMEQQLELP